MGILVKKATLADGSVQDVLIEGNKIAKVAGEISESGHEKMDARGKFSFRDS